MKEEKDRNIPVNMSVRRIKELSFYINEGLIGIPNNQPIKIEIGMNFSYKIEIDLVFLNLRVYYHYPDASPTEILTDILVQNIFEISDLRRFQIEETIVLPPHVITTVVGLSISHVRALLAKNISGTVFQENLMAIINPEELARHFFPQMFA